MADQATFDRKWIAVWYIDFAFMSLVNKHCNTSSQMQVFEQTTFLMLSRIASDNIQLDLSYYGGNALV